MPLDFYLDAIEKKNPAWDGDGVQGAGQTRDRRGRWGKGGAVAGATLALAGIAAGAAFAGHINASGIENAPTPSTSISSSAKVKVDKPTPAPTTVAGFKKMWDKVDTAEWGAADVSLSVAMPDGRSVWLYGDTFSGNNGFVHSSAITQDGGNLHVSNGGKQLLPNDGIKNGRKQIYWIEQAKSVGGNKIDVTAAPMSIGKANSWDFQRRDARSRIARVVVDKIGNLKFVKWLKWVKAPSTYNDFKVIGEHHFTYEARGHPEFKLKNGKVLMTVNQNWDDGVFHTNPDGSLKYEDYRPIFYAGSGEEIRKANILWDGDGVQGAGQPRDRMGRWIALPGPTTMKRMKGVKVRDGKWEVHVERSDGNMEVHSYGTKSKANDAMNNAIKTDRDTFLDNQKTTANIKRRKDVREARQKRVEENARRAEQDAASVAGQTRRNKSPLVPATGRQKREPAKIARAVEVKDTDRLPVPGRPTMDQANKATANARRTMPDNEAKYAGLIVRLLKNKGITQDPKQRHKMAQTYNIPAGRLIQIEQEMYNQMFPPAVQQAKSKKAPATFTTKQLSAMRGNGAEGGKGFPLIGKTRDGRYPTLYKATKGPHAGEFVVSDRDGKTRRADPQEQQKALAGARYRAEQKAILESMDEDAATQKAYKRSVAAKWAESQGLDPTDTHWHAFFWNDSSLLQNQKDESEVPLNVNLAPPERRVKMNPAELESLLAMEDIDSRKMRGHRPDSKKAMPGDEDFVEASEESRMTDAEWESKSKDRVASHRARIGRAYQNYKAKHPNSKMTLAEFTDDYYNSKLRIPGGARSVRKREQPAGYVTESLKIKENKKTHEGTVHKFKAAKWTHPNGHPRCVLCGDEEPIGGVCNKKLSEAEQQEEWEKWLQKVDPKLAAARRNRTPVTKRAGNNPFWDGDGVQGVGQPRGHHGRWVKTPGRSSYKKIGVWPLQDGGFGVFADEDNLVGRYGTARAAEKRAARIVEEDRGMVSSSRSSNRRGNPWDSIKFKPLQGRPHKPLGPDGKPLAKKGYSPEEAAYKRNNGSTKISNLRLKALKKDRTLATKEEKELLLSAAAQVHIDGSDPIKIMTARGVTTAQPRYRVMSDIARELANDAHRGVAPKGKGGQVVRRQGERQDEKRAAENRKKMENGRSKWETKAKRQWLLDEFGNGHAATCIICGDKGKPVTMATVSPERIKPGGDRQKFGGVYEEGNVAPSHATCNNAAATRAQYHPEEYYRENLERLLKIYAQQRKKNPSLGKVIAKHRKMLKMLEGNG